MTPHPKNPTKHIIRKRKVEVLWTPCVWEPSLQEIESARADYTAWRRAIIEIAGALRYMKLFEHELTGELPPLNPWETPAGGSRRASTPSP